MRITCSYRGKQKVNENSEADFTFGRAEEKFPIGLDLTPDAKVSRLHGRIWFEDNAWWIEHRNSSRGTRLNDVEIKERGKHQLRLHDILEAGDTKLEIEPIQPISLARHTTVLQAGPRLTPNSD